MIGIEAPASSRQRRALVVQGMVQGIGFRPSVFSLANDLGLGGLVQNRSGGVLIEIEGPPSRLAAFVARLPRECSPLARIEALTVADLPPRGDSTFRIESSDVTDTSEDRSFSPDLATCEDCLRELFDRSDRRYRYPFINCARCGPRLTLISAAPYDRQRTTMAAFAMCDACRSEYEDAGDRRFHAQAIACWDCGPELVARAANGERLDVDPIAFFKELLSTDRIVAVKGIGGYHLACDAGSETAVAELRRRKQRDAKPFALMVRDLEGARRLCEVSQLAASLLCSRHAPIALLPRRARAPIADAVAPDARLLGLMLPYSPLHHLLAREAEGRPIVLTSANRSDQPIACDDEEALQQLRGIADGFLSHDRRINLRCDDSVVRIVAERPLIIRRARGYVPERIPLPYRIPARVLALGGQLKNTIAFAHGEHAFLGHHLGDLGDYDAYRSFREAVARFESLFGLEPEIVVHDLHPGYATTEYAQERSARARLIAVQHHHAHMASCMAENGLTREAVGVTFDGTGYGADGALWGGEFLVGGYRAVRRAAHLRAVALPGGERAIREPWRMALAYLIDAGEEPERWLPAVPSESLRVISRMIERGLHCPPTTSAGRLFDAVAALLGLHARVTFEGQAATALESLAASSDAADTFPIAIDGSEVDTRTIVHGVLSALRRGDPRAAIARCFHNTIAEVVAAVSSRVREETGIEDVVLSGGVFQNALLTEGSKQRLERRGLRVWMHARVPANDGGLSLGQLAVAAAQLEGES